MESFLNRFLLGLRWTLPAVLILAVIVLLHLFFGPVAGTIGFTIAALALVTYFIGGEIEKAKRHQEYTEESRRMREAERKQDELEHKARMAEIDRMFRK